MLGPRGAASGNVPSNAMVSSYQPHITPKIAITFGFDIPERKQHKHKFNQTLYTVAVMANANNNGKFHVLQCKAAKKNETIK